MENEAGEEAKRVGEMLDAHLPGLQRFIAARAARSVLAREEAQDLAQSVCRDVLEHIKDGRMQVRSTPEFKQWIYEAAVLKLRTRLRHHGAQRRDPGREAVRLDATDAGGATPADSATPSRFANVHEQRERVQQAIEELGGRDAQVLRLAILDERPHAEVAEHLGIEPSPSRVLLSRALAKLARLLGEE